MITLRNSIILAMVGMMASSTTTTRTRTSSRNAIHWFRKGLRLTDNPALLQAIEHCNQHSSRLYPLYILDGDSYQLRHCTALRANFLVECLQDLDQQLRSKGSRLYVASGDPLTVLPQLLAKWDIDLLTHEADESGEAYATQRDVAVQELVQKHNVRRHAVCSETIFPLRDYVEAAKNKLPTSMGMFQKLFAKMGPVPDAQRAPPKFPPCDESVIGLAPPKKPTDLPWPRNTPKDKVTPLWGPDDCQNLTPIAHGGETLALERVQKTIADKPNYVATFEKPETSYTVVEPSTTALSPYMSWGCLSPRTVWHAISKAQTNSTAKTRSKPPVSLHGQLLWRDLNNLMAHDVGAQWNSMEGNKHCRSIPWDDDPLLLKLWKEGQTGYPWIDANMRQLKQEGWMHHLGRHAVACFLTRGDLWQSWKKGAEHFESHLLDADYSLNGFNWIWLSCSGFFYQYFRCYSPVAFAKNKDGSHGAYVRKFCPELAKLPQTYLYEPWTAPKHVLVKAGVDLGTKYPRPIVDHATISKTNMGRMKYAYDAIKAVCTETKGGSRSRTATTTSGEPLPSKRRKTTKK